MNQTSQPIVQGVLDADTVKRVSALPSFELGEVLRLAVSAIRLKEEKIYLLLVQKSCPAKYELYDVGSAAELFGADTAAWLRSNTDMWTATVLRYHTAKHYPQSDDPRPSRGWEALDYKLAHGEYFRSLDGGARTEHLFAHIVAL